MDEVSGYEKKIEEPDTREEPITHEDHQKIKTDEEDDEDGKEDTDLDEDTARDEKETLKTPEPNHFSTLPDDYFRDGQKVKE